jgi:UDP-N-acetylmuramoyl-tripeptide--D-alanyl-D-alanine ligase
LAIAGLALADFGDLKGRGQRTAFAFGDGEVLIIDETYNANPASMAATLRSLGKETRAKRRIAVLGPMRELGAHSDKLHADLAPEIIAAHVDRLILLGDETRPLEVALEGRVPINRAQDVDHAARILKDQLQPWDAVLVKASNSVGLAALVEQVAGEMACST